jgi:hypothetical protein
VVTAFVLFRPEPGRAVMVVASTDADAVEAAMRPLLGTGLCVTSSRWTKQQIEAAQADIHANMGPWGIYLAGPQVDEDVQTTVVAELVRVVPAAAAWANAQPAGLVRLKPWLTPLGR